MIGAVFMIVKIFCAVLVALGVSVAIVLGGLIILASCASVRKKPAGDNTADDDFTYNFFFPAKLFK